MITTPMTLQDAPLAHTGFTLQVKGFGRWSATYRIRDGQSGQFYSVELHRHPAGVFLGSVTRRDGTTVTAKPLRQRLEALARSREI